MSTALSQLTGNDQPAELAFATVYQANGFDVELVHAVQRHVGLYGHAPRVRLRAVRFSVERRPAGGTDLDWAELPGVVADEVADTGPQLAEQRSPDEALREEADRLLRQRRFGDLVRRSDPVELLRPPLLAETRLRLPRERPAEERWRLLVTEAEMRSVDPEHLDPEPTPERDPRRRVVYLETIEL